MANFVFIPTFIPFLSLQSNGIAAQCRAKSGAFMNVVSVWRKNVTGRGAVVTILDDGKASSLCIRQGMA